MRRNVIGGAAVLLALACDPELPSAPGARAVTISTSTFIVADAGFVSMLSGQQPIAGYATIERFGGGALAVAPTIDGGMDPTYTHALEGDTLTITLASDQGTPLSLHHVVVPIRSRPKVVRTMPSRGRAGVPLNSVVTIVFSEPINPATTTGIQVRLAGAAIAGALTTSGDGLRVVFTPALTFEPNTRYEIVVPPSVADSEGDALQEGLVADFTTGDAKAVAAIITEQPVVFHNPSNNAIRIFQMDAVLRDDGKVEGRYSIMYPESGGRSTGRVACFTIVGSDAWIGGIRETAGSGLDIGSEWVWRISNGVGGAPDRLTLAYSDSTLTAAEWCAATPATTPYKVTMTMFSAEAGELSVTGATPPPTAGTVELRNQISGEDKDLAYAVRLGDFVERVDKAPLLVGVPAGLQQVRVDSLAPNCRSYPDTLRVEAARVTVLHLQISCVPLANAARVITKTTGSSVDPDGYLLDAEYGLPERVGVNDTRDYYTRNPYGVSLADVAANCHVTEPNPQPWSRTTGIMTVTFNVVCEPTTPIAFAAGRDTAYTLDPEATNIYVMPSSGVSRTALTSGGLGDGDPAWSPDGSRIAFRRGRGAAAEIYVMNADGSGVTRLTNNSAAEQQPTWSPDGTRIAFTSDRDGNAEIYVMNANGGNVQRLTNDPARDENPAWSPTTARIAFRSERSGSGDLYSVLADGSGLTRLTADQADDAWPAWSPDGTRIAFSRRVPCSREGEEYAWWKCYDAFTMKADGTLAEQVSYAYPYSWAWTDDVAVRRPSWSPDGKTIAVEVWYCFNDLGDCHEIAAIWLIDTQRKVATSAHTGILGDQQPQLFPSAPAWKRQP